jgi:hypothetical protein
LAAQGADAPFAQNAATFLDLSLARAAVNDRGDVAFSARLAGEPYDSINLFNSHDGTWTLNRNGPVSGILAGMPAPEIGPEAVVVGFGTVAYPAINRFGETAMMASHKLTPGAASTGNSIWVASTGGRELHGATGQPLPKLGASAALSFLSPPGINISGSVVGQANYSGAAVSPSIGSAIITSDSAGLTIETRTGSPAPGTAGHTFQQTFYEPVIGGGGHIAFYGSEGDGTSVGRSGVWAGRPDDLQLVALHGSPAPGANANFGGFQRNTPAINRFGQVAFPVLLVPQSGPSTNSLWATDVDGNLTLIARVGGTIEVAPGDVRTISSVSMLTNHADDDGRARSINDLGQIAFKAIFTDSTNGIFLSGAVAHLPGDYNRDGMVDAGDYIVWRKALSAQNLIADGDRDGMVDEADYELMREFFGVSLELVSGGAAVPEPHLAAFAIFGLVALRDRRTSGSI